MFYLFLMYNLFMDSKQGNEMTIDRINSFGFVNFAVMFEGTELVRFDSYYDAVDFIRCMEEMDNV